MHGHIRYGSIGMPYKHYDTQKHTHKHHAHTHAHTDSHGNIHAHRFFYVSVSYDVLVAGLDSVIK